MRSHAFPSRRVLSAAFAVAAALVVALTSAVAGATLALTTGYPLRTNRQGRTAIAQSTSDNNTGINRDNCEEGNPAVWKFNFSNLPQTGWTHLEVWATATTGGTCSDQFAGTVVTHTCFHVASIDYNTLETGQKIGVVPDRAIVAAIVQAADVTDPSNVPESVCDPTSSMEQTPFQLNFFLRNNSTLVGTPGSNEYELQFQSTYDLRGPDGPTDVKLGVGDSLLVATWSTGVALDPQNKGFQAFCFPVTFTGTTDGGTTETGDATADSTNDAATDTATDDTATDDTATDDTGADDASTDDAGETEAATDAASDTAIPSIGSGCGVLPADFQPGQLPNPSYKCSGIGAGTSVTITNLTNEVTYAVGIAGVDVYNNPGGLSNIVCQHPVPTKDFYQAYHDAGGTAGGGYCSVGWSGGSFAGGAMASLFACGLLVRRARRGRR